MANELTVTLAVRYNKGNFDDTVPSSGSPFSYDITGTLVTHVRKSIGTSEEALELGEVDISANGGAHLVVKNDDATNFIEIRDSTGGNDLVKVLPGGVAYFMITSTATAPFAIANSAACEIEYMLVAG